MSLWLKGLKESLLGCWFKSRPRLWCVRHLHFTPVLSFVLQHVAAAVAKVTETTFTACKVSEVIDEYLGLGIGSDSSMFDPEILTDIGSICPLYKNKRSCFCFLNK